jgi:hypothetical protein
LAVRRAFPFAYFTINSGNYKQKTNIKGQKIRLTIRKYQGVSRYTILEYWGVSGRIKMYHFLSFFLSCSVENNRTCGNFPFFVQKPPQNPLYFFSEMTGFARFCF